VRAAGLRPAVGDPPRAERGRVVARRLLRVPHREDQRVDVIGALRDVGYILAFGYHRADRLASTSDMVGVSAWRVSTSIRYALSDWCRALALAASVARTRAGIPRSVRLLVRSSAADMMPLCRQIDSISEAPAPSRLIASM